MKLSDTLKQYAAKLRQEIAGRTFSEEHPAPPIDEIEWAAEIVTSIEGVVGPAVYVGAWVVVVEDVSHEPAYARVGQVVSATANKHEHLGEATVSYGDDEDEDIVDEYSDLWIASVHRTQSEAMQALEEFKRERGILDDEQVVEDAVRSIGGEPIPGKPGGFVFPGSADLIEELGPLHPKSVDPTKRPATLDEVLEALTADFRRSSEARRAREDAAAKRDGGAR